MANERGVDEKATSVNCNAIRSRGKFVGLMRLLCVFATLTATILMALNKETKTIVVATIGTTSMKATLTAKFQHTPANVFFVVANALATFHNILVLASCVFGKKLDRKGIRFTMILIFDIVNLGILSAGASSAAFMAELANHGNSHAAWNKVCDKFETFCKHGAGALLASYIGLALLLIITVASTIRLRPIENKTINVSDA